MTIASRVSVGFILVFASLITSAAHAQNFYNYGYGSGGLFATPDYVSISRNGRAHVDVTANDLNTENPNARLELSEIHAPPEHGTAWISWDQNNHAKLAYSPRSGFTGIDTVIYRLVDGSGASSLGLFTINVANTGLTAASEFAMTKASKTIAIYPLQNDVSGRGRPFEISNLITRSGDAIMKYDGNGKQFIEYTPFSFFTGVDILLYQVTDSLNQTSNEAQISIAVEGRAPVAGPDFATVLPKQRVAIDVLLNDIDPEGAPTELVSIGRTPLNGVAIIRCVQSKCQIEYKAGSAFKAEDTLTYFVRSGYGPMTEATVTVRMND